MVAQWILLGNEICAFIFLSTEIGLCFLQCRASFALWNKWILAELVIILTLRKWIFPFISFSKSDSQRWSWIAFRPPTPHHWCLAHEWACQVLHLRSFQLCGPVLCKMHQGPLFSILYVRNSITKVHFKDGPTSFLPSCLLSLSHFLSYLYFSTYF